MIRPAVPAFPGVRVKTSKGREYWYLEHGGARHRLPAPSDPAFLPAFIAARSSEAHHPERTFTLLVRLYRASDRWQRLASRTRRDYERVLIWSETGFGQRRPDQIRRMDVAAAVAAESRRVRFANSIKEVLSVLFEFAIGIGWMEHNPAKGVRRLPARGQPMHRPWPDKALEAFCAQAGATERTICEMALGTGQRIGDLLRMRWDHISDGGISVTQSKTGTPLWIPLTARLAAYLATLPRRSLTIISGQQGRPLTYDAASKRVRRVRTACGALAFTIHGWRYTAAAHLAEAGASDAEIMSITGHLSLKMVRLYAGSARQRAHATTAQLKRKDRQ